MKTITLLLICCSISLGISAQVIKEKRQAANFEKINANAGINVYFTQGSSYSVEIETDAETMKEIAVSVTDKSLNLGRNTKMRRNNNVKINAYVSAPNLNAVAISSGADFKATQVTNKGDFSIAALGGADIEIGRLVAEDCKIALSGGADCDIKNLQVKNLNLAASGGSDTDINIADADYVKIAVSGGSDVELKGKAKSADIIASGGSDIDIKEFRCDNLNSKKSGGGSIRK